MPTFGTLDDAAYRTLTPLQLAYIGDCVYDLLIRGALLMSGQKLNAMHLQASARVNAAAQAETLRLLMPHLSPDEADMVRRGRNAHARHGAPRSASKADYCASTGLEAMVGMLYVRGREDRLRELFALVVQESGK
ncbi:MAG: Mini-ribonuclease 3 [Christensenellales bacterium]